MKRKKYPKLPNGFGSIRYLGTGRRNPYGVYAPSTEQDENGVFKRGEVLGYVPDYFSGIKILTMYHDGQFKKGDVIETNIKTLDDLIASVTRKRQESQTFSEVYEAFFKDKYESGKEYSKQSIGSTKAAYRNSTPLYNMPFTQITHSHMQKVIDELPLKHSSKELLVSLYRQMSEYAYINHIIDRDESVALKIKTPDDDESGQPFTAEELKLFWERKSDPMIAMILIMCYSGFRISEYKKMTINLEERYFRGGVKTQAGKDRVVPIHSAIQPLVEARIQKEGALISTSVDKFRSLFVEALRALGIEGHTPHDTRHTFSMLCEKYKVDERDQKRMLGHSFKDVTNKVYGHRELEDLREEIEKIKLCPSCF